MQVANKVWIGSIMSGNMVFNGDKFVAVEVSNKNMSRVNLIANVVDSYNNPEKQFNSVTLDDGSGQIRIKGFTDNSFLLEGISVGETICVIGWLRHYNNELYVVPDIVRRVEDKWAMVRRLELIKLYGEVQQQKAAVAESVSHSGHAEHSEKIAESNNSGVIFEVKSEKIGDNKPNIKQVLLELVKKKEEGIDIEQLIMETNFPVEQINSTITSLIESGEIYEPMPGKLRSL